MYIYCHVVLAPEFFYLYWQINGSLPEKVWDRAHTFPALRTYIVYSTYLYTNYRYIPYISKIITVHTAALFLRPLEETSRTLYFLFWFSKKMQGLTFLRIIFEHSFLLYKDVLLNSIHFLKGTYCRAKIKGKSKMVSISIGFFLGCWGFWLFFHTTYKNGIQLEIFKKNRWCTLQEQFIGETGIYCMYWRA